MDGSRVSAQSLLERLESRIREQVRQAVPEVPESGADAELEAPEGRRPLEGPTVTPEAVPAAQDSTDGGEFAAPDKDGGRARAAAKPSLGIEAIESRRNIPGVRVVRFFDHSRADNAGLAPGDLIIALNGLPTPDIPSVGQQLAQRQIGDTVTLRVVRGGRTIDVRVPLVGPPPGGGRESGADRSPTAAGQPGSPPATLGRPAADGPVGPATNARPEGRSQTVGPPRLGVQVVDATVDQGAVVTSVTEGSTAAVLGLRQGDRIVSLNGGLVASSRGLLQRVAALGRGDRVTVQFVRDARLIERAGLLGVAGDAKGEREADHDGGSSGPSENPSGWLSGFGSLLGGAAKQAGAPDEPSGATAKGEAGSGTGAASTTPSAAGAETAAGTSTTPPGKHAASAETKKPAADSASSRESDPQSRKNRDERWAEVVRELRQRIKRLEARVRELEDQR